jgi:hypothetical protein
MAVSILQTWFGIALSFLAIILIPLLVMLVRIVQKATRLEGNQERISNSLISLVQDKEKIHAAMLDQMKDDRRATDIRLRWLEEHYWKTNP